MPRCLARFVVSLFVLTPFAYGQTTWVLDEAGGGDFTELDDALASIDAGDVLWIRSGTYGSALTTQAVTLLGESGGARPSVGNVEVVGAARVTLANLDVFRLELRAVPGVAIVDGCKIGPSGFLYPSAGAVTITNCSDVRIARSEVLGGINAWAGFTAVLVREGSTVQISNSRLVGGSGVATPGFYGEAGDGGSGLTLFESTAYVTSSDLIGGDGENLVSYIGSATGRGGDGLGVISSQVDVRGGGGARIEGGSGNAGASGGFDGRSIVCGTLSFGAASEASVSGAALVGDVAGDCVEYEPSTRPAIDSEGEFGPGEARRVNLYGDPGAVGVVLLSSGAESGARTMLLGAPLFVSLANQLLLEAGQLDASTGTLSIGWNQPSSAALAGTELFVQGAQLHPDGTFEGTNASVFVLGF